jgi:hypothetical protein
MFSEFARVRSWIFLTSCLLSLCCSPSHQTATGTASRGDNRTTGTAAIASSPVQNGIGSASSTPQAGVKTDAFLEKILERYPAYFREVLDHRDSLGVQVIYSQIDRNRNNVPTFKDYYLNVDPARYFYPASTVKLPVALLALQRLHELQIPGLDGNTTMLTDTGYEGQTMVINDPCSPDGRPSVNQYIKEIFLTSDNEAFNRLYEWLGPAYINAQLHQMGYGDIQIRHRVNVTLREDQNRHANPVRFTDTGTQVIYAELPRTDTFNYMVRADTVDGVYFGKKNRISLEDLHQILRSALFPSAVSARQRFNIGKEQYGYLLRCMSELPSQTRFPTYDTLAVWDAYVKYLMFGGHKGSMPAQIRMLNKIGDAYGFLIDCAYIADTASGVEFMLSAVIRCNPDGKLGDEHYTYEELGFPFMQHLGEAIYQFELDRPRKYKPDLSWLQCTYDR